MPLFKLTKKNPTEIFFYIINAPLIFKLGPVHGCGVELWFLGDFTTLVKRPVI